MKSFKPSRPGDGPRAGGCGRNVERNFYREKRTNATHASTTDRDARHPGYRQSQRARHCIEEVFAWGQAIAGQSKTKHRRLERVRWHFTLATAAYNLIRLPKLLGAAP